MMQQQQIVRRPPEPPEERPQPRRRDVFLHGIKTFKVMKALLTDRRIQLWRKGAFLASIAAMLVVLIFPDVLGEAVASVVLPVIGTVLGVPLDAGVDWIAFALLAVSFLRFFPAEIVSEHYRTIFER